MADWEIDKSLGKCWATDKEFEVGQGYFGALVETENGLQRRDFCSDYFQQENPEVFCYWKTKVPPPNKKKQIFIDDEMLMTFFSRLQGETEQEKISFRFVLALILMRKRRLKYDSTKDDNGKEIWRLRIVGEQEFTEVENPHLDEEQIEKLSMQVGVILQVDFE